MCHWGGPQTSPLDTWIVWCSCASQHVDIAPGPRLTGSTHIWWSNPCKIRAMTFEKTTCLYREEEPFPFVVVIVTARQHFCQLPKLIPFQKLPGSHTLKVQVPGPLMYHQMQVVTRSATNLNWVRDRECPHFYHGSANSSRALKPQVNGACDHLAIRQYTYHRSNSQVFHVWDKPLAPGGQTKESFHVPHSPMSSWFPLFRRPN